MLAGLRRMGYLAAFVALAGFAFPAAAQQADSASILIYDASGSMWGQLDGGVDRPPLNGSTLKYGFGHEGGP